MIDEQLAVLQYAREYLRKRSGNLVTVMDDSSLTVLRKSLAWGQDDYKIRCVGDCVKVKVLYGSIQPIIASYSILERDFFDKFDTILDIMLNQ